MSLPVNQNWTLKDKKGKEPTADMLNKLQTLLKSLDKNQLFPCPSTPDDLEMKQRETAPREMNSFIIFRRQLAIIVKRMNQSDDGKILSLAASLIWNGASKEEKGSYREMAGELKRRHIAKYPDYTYERRKRKTAEEDFVIVKPESIKQKKRKIKAPKPKTNAAPNPVSEECAPTSTSLPQEQENAKWSYDNAFNPIFIPDNTWNYNDTLFQAYLVCPDNSRDPGPVSTISIPAMNMVLTPNYTNMGPQDINQLQRQVNYEQQRLHEQINLPQHINLQQVDYSNSNYFVEGGDPGIDQFWSSANALGNF